MYICLFPCCSSGSSIHFVIILCVGLFWAALRRVGVKGVEIRKAEQLQDVGSLIIPGGESTTMAKLAEYHNLVFHSLPLLLFSFT